MMRLLILLASLAGTSSAETARVLSGEHADFTRLVVEIPKASGWTVGRTAMGYGFATTSAKPPVYDLSMVWDRIPRTRLQAVRADPDSGALLLTLACDCHVFPFEYQPGTIVLDIRDGKAPVDSVFEGAFSSDSASPPGDMPPLVRAAPPYEWIDRVRHSSGAPEPVGFPVPEVRATAPLDPLRDELLLQLSRGAADGVVEMVLPGTTASPEVMGMGDLSGALIRIGELPGLEVGERTPGEDRHPDDGACLPEDAIALHSWGGGGAPLDLLAEARSGLFEEFDKASPDALRHAIKVHLFLGFGAEALQYGALMPGSEADTGTAPLMSMARLIDGESDPTSPFAPMLGCDGSAALWAALAHSNLPQGQRVNTSAIVRSFQALPAHLRRHLGPRLADLLLDQDAEAARMIRDAMERTPDIPTGTVALFDAEADLRAERPEEALSHAEAAVGAGGTGLSGLVALVEAHFQASKPLSPDVAGSLMAYRDVGAEDRDRRSRALVLALALSGQVDEAFAQAKPGDPVLADLWQVVALLSEDNAFLRHAVLRPTDPAPSAEADVALAIAARLGDLGFPESALIWLGPVDGGAAQDRRLAAAKAEQALGNARAAIRLLAGLSGQEVEALRAAAHQQLGAYDAARRALDTAGKAEEGARLAAWDADWDLLSERGTPAWAKAADLVDPVVAGSAGPLAEGEAALEESAAARLALGTLLAEVPVPIP